MVAWAVTIVALVVWVGLVLAHPETAGSTPTPPPAVGR